MSSAPRSSPIRQLGSLLALAFLCTLAVLTFSQCKYGPDKVTGIDRAKQSPASQCIRNCAEQFEDSLDAENKLHKKNLKLCGDGDDDDDDDGPVLANPGASGDGRGDGGADPACIAQENARHQAAVARITAGRQQCIEGCHHQGGGTGR